MKSDQIKDKNKSTKPAGQPGWLQISSNFGVNFCTPAFKKSSPALQQISETACVRVGEEQRLRVSKGRTRASDMTRVRVRAYGSKLWLGLGLIMVRVRVRASGLRLGLRVMVRDSDEGPG
jgi:hypothetical protein